MKRCVKCSVEQDQTGFYRSSQTRDGLQAWCKSCRRVESNARYRANRDAICAQNRERYANLDPEVKSRYSLEQRLKNREYRAAYGMAWYASNKEAVKAKNRARYRAQRARIIEQAQMWAKANPKKVAAAKRRWRERNPDAARAAKAAWKRANPERNRLYHHKYRAAKAAAAGAAYTTPALIEGRIELYGGRCRYCRKPWNSIDHRIPIARGGSNWPANLVPVCVSCNSRKNARTEKEYLALLAREGVMANHG